MAYSLKTTGVIAGYTVRVCLVVNEAGTGVQDLVAANTISVHANVTYGTTAWRGTPRKWFMPTGTGFTPQGVTWTGTKPPFNSAGAGPGVTCLFIINGWGPNKSDGGTNPNTRPILYAVNAASSFANCFRLGDTDPTIGRGGAEMFSGTVDNLGDVQSAYYMRARAYGTCGCNRRTAAGTFGTEETSTDAGFGIDDAGTIWAYANDTQYWFEPETYACLVVDGVMTKADADTITDDWFGTLIESGGGGGGGGGLASRKLLLGTGR